MAFRIHSGSLVVSARYLKVVRGVYWYQRRIPQDLVKHLDCGLHVRRSLSTKDLPEAARRMQKLNAHHEAHWRALRAALSNGGTPKEIHQAAKALVETKGITPGAEWALDAFDHHLHERYGMGLDEMRFNGQDALGAQEEQLARVRATLSSVDLKALELITEPEKPEFPYLSEARDLYLQHDPRSQRKRFRNDINLALSKALNIVGDLPLNAYTRQHAITIRDAMLGQELKTTYVRRCFAVISCVFNAINQEHALGLTNPFSNVRIVALGHDSQRREEFTLEELSTIAAACRSKDDSIRHIVSLALDTGARLGELVGLRVCDVKLADPVPHIDIRRYDGRTVKTDPSERKVPLVGEALWAATRALENAIRQGKDPNHPVFSYGPEGSNTASATLNKWIRRLIGSRKSVHCFRHTMQTRLRNAGVPEDIQCKLGGWTMRHINRGYGSYSLEVLKAHVEKVVLP